MIKKLFSILLLLNIFATSACQSETPTPAPEVTPAPTTVALATDTPVPTPEPTTNPEPQISGETWVVISQVMAGDFDFVELYNTRPDPVNLKGYQLSYRLGTSKEDLPIYTFTTDFWLPAYHHALLVREGDELGVSPDAIFSQQMNIKTGGVGLYDPDGNLVDALAWGKAPDAFIEGNALDAMPKDAAFERLPAKGDGNYIDTNDNAADFITTAPDPRNTFATAMPLPAQRLDMRLTAPQNVEPGQSFDYELTLENLTGQDLTGVLLTLPLPESMTIAQISDDGTAADNEISWTIDALAADESVSRKVTVQAPWTIAAFRVDHAQATSPDLPRPVLGTAAFTDVSGGTIPIGVARGLEPGTRITVEGSAVMYTGGYYAGGGNTKFYLQDETGGIQVQVFGESGDLPTVKIGDTLRVSGKIVLYRDSIELVPDVLPDDVAFVAAETPLSPKQIAIADVKNPELTGQYIAVTGKATRIEEFNYSYEMDLMDDAGNTILVYIDKLTKVTTDDFDVGKLYTVAGVLEYYQGKWQLKPRVTTDFAEVFPPVLRVELSAPNTIQAGESLEYALTAFNHTDAPLTKVIISSGIPAPLDEVFDGGVIDGDVIHWDIPSLPAGDSFTAHFTVTAPDGVSQIINEGYQATATEFDDPATGLPFRTFIGDTVPVWAIQGEGFKSPYVNSQLQTEGVVIATFDPEQIPGFFIQEINSDDDPATSAGLFVWNDADISPAVQSGDLVRVTGTVKEKSGQTQLQLSNVEIVSSGNPLPTPIQLSPPQDDIEAENYFEAMEGMLVSVDTAIAVSPISKYGETSLVLPQTGIDRIYKHDPRGWVITLDEDSWAANYADNTDLPFSVTTGDILSDIEGPLAYTYGQYKIEPLTPPMIVAGDFDRAPTLAETPTDAFSLAQYNVENFFDNKDPNPSSPPRPSRTQYVHKAMKIANSIAAMGYPTIIAFEEVENIKVLEKVAAQPPLDGYDYQAVLIEGTDSRGIDVGYLVRGDRVSVQNTELRLDDAGIFTRGPLLMESIITTDDGDVTLYTIANHFVSMGAGFDATEPRRVKQAQWNVDIANEILAKDPNALIAILGDLNTFFDTESMQVFRDAGFVHVFDGLSAKDRYTYIFEGESETLDHILMSPALAARMDGVQVLHINADFPPADPTDESPNRTSDHDPVVATFK